MAITSSGNPDAISSLTRSFSDVPAAAVPAIIDCVVASSSFSPSLLFSSLLDSFPNPSGQGFRSNQILSYISALCHLITKTKIPEDALREFVWKVFMPVLKAMDPNDLELLSQVEVLLFDVVSILQAWNLMGDTLVRYCMMSVGFNLGMLRSDNMAIYQWRTEDSLEMPGTLSLPIACQILTYMLECVLRSGMVVPNVKQKLEGFAANVLWDLSNLSVAMLMLPTEDRSFSIRLLLPSLLKWLNLVWSVEVLVNGSPYRLSRSCFAKQIWKCCMSLFSFGDLERRDAYNVLSLYFSVYNQELHKDIGRDNTSTGYNITTEKEFWEEMRRGLVDRDATLRKQALYILKLSFSNNFSSSDGQFPPGDPLFTTIAQTDQTTSSNGTLVDSNMTKKGKWAEKEAKSLGVGEVCYFGEHRSLTGQNRWKVFLLLYEMLEEYGTHLVEAAWTHQISLLFQSMPLHSCLPATCLVNRAQMETTEGIFSWLAVLWERGFFHDNPQVRCLVMQSFLGVDWEEDGNFASKVPRSFVLGPLLLGLNDVVHHKDFGVKGIYMSRAIQGATKYLFNFSCQMSLSERVDFVWSLASVARKESFGRAGLMTLAFGIASAACPTDSCNVTQEYSMGSSPEVEHSMGSSPEVEHIKSAQGFILPSKIADLLDVLGSVIESSKQHFNPNYRLQVCEQVMKAACSMINICDVPLGMLLHFLSTVPREFTDCAGTLRVIVQQWLTQINNVDKGFCPFDSGTRVLNDLSFPMSFVMQKHCPDSSFTFDDEDVDAWGLEAQRWARVLFLVVRDAQHLESIFMFLRNYCSSLCNQDGRVEWVPVKLLILILSLVEELQLEWRKCKSYGEQKSESEHIRTRKLHCPSSILSSFDCINILGHFSSILMDLVAFSKLVAPVLCSFSVIMDTQLPQSLRGRLGGPSQRRLPSLTTTSVLEAILSLKTVACVLSLCIQLGRDHHLDHSFTFLWDFSWKVIQSHSHNSETAAELCLAQYEALASVFKAWSLSFSPDVCDFIAAYNESVVGAAEVKPLLDPLVDSFICHVNELLANGALTRSRRAVLMNWKWLCLDSLLVIPSNVIKNEVHIENTSTFFSYPTLRSTFTDIVESLENAGESSTLYMLRSMRLVLGYLCSYDIRPIVSSGSGVTCQMMEQLAHSSWVLHLSCNKRRVAPIAALLSSVLHQSVFGDLKMHESNDSQLAPLKWFIGNLLDEGVKSPRTIRLAALHLTGLWLLHPRTVKYYIDELTLLSLYGSVAFDEDFEAELIENQDARTEVSLLAQSPDRELTEVFINTELYARVSVAVLFFKLAKLAKVRGREDNEDSLAALDCGKVFLLELLEFAVNDNDLAKELYKKYSAVHRRKVRAWQMICILSHFVEQDIVEEVTSNLHICLYRNNLPAVRQYLEVFAIQVYLKFPMLVKEQLIPIFHDQNMRPQALSSYVFIAANLILHASESQVQKKHLNDLLPPIIPFLTSHHHSLRGFAQLLVHCVLCKLWPASKIHASEDAPLEKKCFDDLKLYLMENVDCMRLRKSMEGFLYAFDPSTSATPAGVFSARNEGSGFECVPISLMEQVTSFLNDVRDDLRNSIAKDAMTIQNEALAAPGACEDIAEPLEIKKRESLQIPKDLGLDFQKKITLSEHLREATNNDRNCFQANAKFSGLLSEIEREDQLLCPALESRIRSMERIRGSQQEIILVASLLDRIPNLAGLARTCEVFKASGLTVANASVLQDKQFQLISVTAEKWIPIIEVPVHSIKIFLEKKRREGFKILGLEQTANSTPLDQHSFQNKTVLVLGREKEGIPVDIIHVLDACVEIPQLGIIRSLNVHVSGAIALWEYTRQQRTKQT